MGHSMSSEPKPPRSQSQIFLKLFVSTLINKIWCSSFTQCGLKIAKNAFSKKVAFSKTFFEKITFARCLEFCIMVFLQTNFKFFKFANFQNLSNPPYWILKMQKNVIFSGSVQNYCCYKGQTGKIQLGRSKVAPRMKKIIFCR